MSDEGRKEGGKQKKQKPRILRKLKQKEKNNQGTRTRSTEINKSR